MVARILIIFLVSFHTNEIPKIDGMCFSLRMCFHLSMNKPQNATREEIASKTSLKSTTNTSGAVPTSLGYKQHLSVENIVKLHSKVGNTKGCKMVKNVFATLFGRRSSSLRPRPGIAAALRPDGASEQGDCIL